MICTRCNAPLDVTSAVLTLEYEKMRCYRFTCSCGAETMAAVMAARMPRPKRERKPKAVAPEVLAK